MSALALCMCALLTSALQFVVCSDDPTSGASVELRMPAVRSAGPGRGNEAAASRQIIKHSATSRQMIKPSATSRQMVKPSATSRQMAKPSATSRQMAKPSATDLTGHPVVCVDGPYIICGSSSSNSTGANSSSANDDKSNNIIVAVRGSRHVALSVTGLNIPGWLRREWAAAPTCSRDLCTFRQGQVTEETDVVVVHAKLLPESSLPRRRWAEQLYLLMNWEPPHKVESPLATGDSVWTDQFNLTMSYRLDSDIFYPSQKVRFEPKPLHNRPDYNAIARGKTKMAAWFVSNCHTVSDREGYVTELRRYIDVDIYGACGQPAPCRFDMDNQPCLFEILKEYRFYLSFENSFCTDYATEKIFKIYTADTFIIPVVRGALDYDRYLPNQTFINTAHFQSPKDLALYLQHLASDVATYSKYLEYKDMYTLETLGNRFCQLCLDLHSLSVRPGKYQMRQWLWQGCHYPQDMPQFWRLVSWGCLLCLAMLTCVVWCRYLGNVTRCQRSVMYQLIRSCVVWGTKLHHLASRRDRPV